MKILVVCSTNNGLSPFVKDQVDSLKACGVYVDIFGIKGNGSKGYLKNLTRLKKRIKKGRYNIIHAHFGLSGLLANLQRAVPVITTYHGSDVNRKSNVKYSRLSARLSCYNILTNAKLNDILDLKNHFSIIPCGIDFKNFKPMERAFCKQKMGLSAAKDYILFSSSFNREEKNPLLAQKTVAQLENTEMLELKGYSREEVNLLINASKLVLITSYHETGPLIAKEALACNTPVVSTDVGDVKQIIDNAIGSYLADGSLKDLVIKCRLVLKNAKKPASRNHVKKYQLTVIAKKIKRIYPEFCIP